MAGGQKKEVEKQKELAIKRDAQFADSFKYDIQ